MPDIWLVTESKLPSQGVFTLSAQSEKTVVSFGARLVAADQVEMQHRQAPLFLTNGITIPQPSQFCYRLSVTSEIRRTANLQTARKAVIELQGSLDCSGSELQAAIWDISKHGAGLLTDRALQPYSTTTLMVDLGGDPILLPAEVRHTRLVAGSRPLYLSGLHFGSIGRIASARWKMRFEEAYVAPSRSRRPLELTQHLIPESQNLLVDDSLSKGLAEHASTLLERLQQASQTERKLMKRYLDDSWLKDRDSAEEAIAAMDAKLEVLRSYERELEDSLFKALDSLKRLGQERPAA